MALLSDTELAGLTSVDATLDDTFLQTAIFIHLRVTTSNNTSFGLHLHRRMIYDVASFHRLSVYDLCRLGAALKCCTGLLPQVAFLQEQDGLHHDSDVFAAARY
jgi:hypothetical protein